MKNRSNHIAILFFLAATITPLLLGMIYSVCSGFGLASIPDIGFTTEYWKNAFTSNELFISLGYSFLISVVVILSSVQIALMLTLYLKKRTARGITSYFLFIPLAIPAIIAALISYQALGNSGFVARLFAALHIIHDPQQFPDLVNDPYGIGIIITHLFITVAFFTLLFRSVYTTEKLHVYKELAQSLGADNKQVRKKIIIPVLLRKSMPTIILYGLFIAGSYEIPLLLGTQNPQMISVEIARRFQRYDLQDIPLAYIMALIYTLIILTVLFILYRKNKLIHEANA